MKILFLESYHGGSHKAFAEGLVEHSRHDIDLKTMPERNWKWRMRGAALHFVKEIENIASYDGIIVTDMINLSDFKALAGRHCPPVLLYFHENQITYPPVSGEKNEFHFGIINLTAALGADRILFNSATHLNAFKEGMARYINKLPDYRPDWIMDKIIEKSGVLYPGCQIPGKDVNISMEKDAPPLIIWNHRWEYDKNAKDFFDAVQYVLDHQGDVRLAIMGENFTRIPPVFSEAFSRWKDKILQFGFVEERSEYVNWLKRGSVVISTSFQENFGISVVEAVRFGCFPLLPNRLSYPEILPKKSHPHCLYRNKYDLAEKLLYFVNNISLHNDMRACLSDAMGRFSWDHLIGEYDNQLLNLANMGHRANQG